MDIPTELELVWKPKLITWLIRDDWIYVSGIWIWIWKNITLKIKDRKAYHLRNILGIQIHHPKVLFMIQNKWLATQWNPPMRYRNQTRHPKEVHPMDKS
jgi:hypothetical protein